MMRESIHSVWCNLFILCLLLQLTSCKKNVVDPEHRTESYTIGFKFEEFESQVRPLGTKNQLVSRTNASKRSAVAQQTAGPVFDGDIYYWSFNDESLFPERYASTYWRMYYNDAQEPDAYGTGWSYADYEAGRALSLKGVQQFTLQLPLTGVSALSHVAFDISSSGTGPKSFSIWYTQDGENYSLLQENNQFSNTKTAQTKHSFSFDLSALSLDFSRDLYIRIVPEEGERGDAGAYNEKTGVTKLDNIRLAGLAEDVAVAAVRRMHYHVFDAASKQLVLAGSEQFREGELADFALQLPEGDYIASFVANISNAELQIPERADAASYYIANTFENHQAAIFGVIDTFSVSGDLQRELEMNRYYSEVHFTFTDTKDLSEVKKIEIEALHSTPFYTPFTMELAPELSAPSIITLYPNFDGSHQEIYFNQFIGNRSMAIPLQYRVSVYDQDDELLRSFDVSSELVQNMQLLFSGKLLDSPNGQFVVRLNEQWSGEKQVDF